MIGGISKKKLQEELEQKNKRIKELEILESKYQQTRENLLQIARNLNQRISEVKCLYNITSLLEQPNITIEGILKGTIEQIPKAWQFPEITCAKVTWGDKEFKTENYHSPVSYIKSDIKVYGESVGTIEVGYLEKKPDSFEGPFTKDERELINSISKQLGRIIEQKQAEEGLVRLKKAIETLRLGVTITDKDRKIVYTNPADAKMHGYEINELLGKDVRVYSPKENISPVDEIDKWKGMTRESINVRKDGSTFPVRLISDVVKNNEGETVGFVTISEDLTERMSAEHAKKAFETMRLGVTLTDTERRIIYTNPADALMHGYEVNELIGKDVRIFSPPDLHKYTTKSEITKWKGKVRESINVRKDGSLFPVRLITDVVKNMRGETIAFVTISEDISGRVTIHEIDTEKESKEKINFGENGNPFKK
ncbi:MAG TPA: PAS domain S-box protein [Candidatus Cloacimonetes bacterium]|nr:PAS domain S-box protein [Candidatus Cloacimonadota bacterium]HEX37561.1 PAS domain S-box protein [Candidatus Cloacimonadota bacterium]